jgi:hypothetical protein
MSSRLYSTIAGPADTVRHVVITRFSYRHSGNHGSGPVWKLQVDPLDPRRLDSRFLIFEVTCLPSLAAQSCQDYDWIIIIDQKLPDSYITRLRRLIADRPRTVIHTHSADDNLRGVGWLKPYVMGQPKYLITTNVDDDDALPRQYIEALQCRALEAPLDRDLPSFKVLGTRKALEWDLKAIAGAPLGTMSAWHRTPNGNPSVVSCGYSLLALYPIYDCSVLGLPPHIFAEQIFDPSCHSRRCPEVREQFRRAAATHGLRFPQSTAGCFEDLGTVTGPVVMTNHPFNDQQTRLTESKIRRVPVRGPQTFPDSSIDWQKAIANQRELFLLRTPGTENCSA